MDAATLSRAMGCNLNKAHEYCADFNIAMAQARCTTVNRAAMWCAQIGHESAGLVYMEEIASGKAYEGRRDLGNTVAGDGKRFKGRGPIQLTGRHNYGLFSRWAHEQGLVDTSDYFVRNPTVVATSRWGFLAAAWYWTVARPRLNDYADAGDLFSASCDINGWIKLNSGGYRTPNGYADRRRRWDNCRRLGDALLPTADSQEDDLTPEQDRMLREVYMQMVQGTGQPNEPRTWGWPGWAGGTGEHLTVVDMLRRLVVEVRQNRNQTAALTNIVNTLKGR